jgi:hypothetical protein
MDLRRWQRFRKGRYTGYKDRPHRLEKPFSKRQRRDGYVHGQRSEEGAGQ